MTTRQDDARDASGGRCRCTMPVHVHRRRCCGAMRRGQVAAAIVLGMAIGVRAAASHASPARSASAITLAGPRSDLQLNTTYGYALTVTSTWPEDHVRVIMTVPAAHFMRVFPVNLLRGKTLWLGNVTLRYTAPSQVSRGISVVVELPSSHGRAGHQLLSRTYSLSLASAIAPPARPLGIYLEEDDPTCPLTNVLLNTRYSCTVDIVNGATAYTHIFFIYQTPSSDFASKPKYIAKLPADGEIKETISVNYGEDPVGDSELTTKAVQLAVGYGVVVRPITIFEKNYGVSVAPGQPVRQPLPPETDS
jgi:hypothetical protein